MGYKRTIIYREGLDEWIAFGYPTEKGIRID
jgi:rhodanese-related sulfurtransferase